MVEPSNPEPKPKPKPKRKYTVSDKVLAANRANLTQANADPEKKYRPTPKRLASTYANCLKAREGKREAQARAGHRRQVRPRRHRPLLHSGPGQRQPRGTRRTLPVVPGRRPSRL